jgi:hypothetical protein
MWISWNFLNIFWRILEDLEEFCNVERRLEGGGWSGSRNFWKMKMDLLDFLFVWIFLKIFWRILDFVGIVWKGLQ